MFAESAYLFRHALLRDAAYQLQLPSDRARLHGLALEVIEGVFGGRPAGARSTWPTRVPPAPFSWTPFSAVALFPHGRLRRT